MTIGAVILGGTYVVRRADAPDIFAWKPPLELLDHRALAPASVLLPLLDTSAVDALNIALDSAHLDNAYALVAYDPTLTDAVRLGALLQLGAQFAKANKTTQAVTCYQAAALLATLSPAVSDTARLDAYSQSNQGLRDLNAADAARWVTDQAFLVAQFSPTVQRQVRARRLTQIADDYTGLGLSGLATQARTQANDAPDASNVPTRTVFVPVSGVLPVSPQVVAAKQARVAAAKQLAADLANNAPKTVNDWPADSVSQLSDTLDAEDQARQTYYDQASAATQDPAIKLALARDRVNWLALKYRVARGAFGNSLVAAWSKNSKTIASDLSDAWEEWYRLAQAQAVTAPNANQATEDLIRQELIGGRWGWLANVPETELTQALSDVTQRLIDQAVPALRLDTLTRNGKTNFILVPDERYGKKEQALPK